MADELRWKQPKNSRLTPEEWKTYTTFFTAGGKLRKEKEGALRSYLETLYRRYGEGNPTPKCPVCGNQLSRIQKWCTSCNRDMFVENHIRIRRAGTRGIGDEVAMCAKCGKAPAKVRGLCPNCYAVYRYYKRAGKTEKMEAFPIAPLSKKEKQLCSVCGKRVVFAKGMCNACYRHQYRVKEQEERKLNKFEFEKVDWENREEK